VKLKISTADRKHIREVLATFKKKKTEEETFYELCFCLCAPQTTFKNNCRVLDRLVELDFFHKSYSDDFLHKVVKPARFYHNKTKYLQKAKIHWAKTYEALGHTLFCDGFCKRSWLYDNVAGLGLKAASHLLRNLGEKDLAIIDTHILKFLSCLPPNTNKEYLTIEMQLYEIATKNKLTQESKEAHELQPWEELLHLNLF
jgi:N-glycosylase/DNA lyase